jgi:hypothetical protein
VHVIKWKGGISKRGGGLPREGQNRRNTMAEMWSSGEPIRLLGGDSSGKKDGALERRSGGIEGVDCGGCSVST